MDTRVHQILMNLRTNAAHAMQDQGGLLEVGLKDVMVENISPELCFELKTGNYIELTVSDTGAGIPSDIIGSIFEPYFPTKPAGEGTGLGLSVIHGIVASYGGKITVDSKPGQGAVFTILLPVRKKSDITHSRAPGELPRGSERILYLDDEAAIAGMGAQMLTALGYSVTERTSSIDALNLFRSKPYDFDLVITDMTMPNLRGDQLAVELMKIMPDIPVILSTGYNRMLSDEIVRQLGIKALIYKPVSMADLSTLTRKVLDEAKSPPEN